MPLRHNKVPAGLLTSDTALECHCSFCCRVRLPVQPQFFSYVPLFRRHSALHCPITALQVLNSERHSNRIRAVFRACIHSMRRTNHCRIVCAENRRRWIKLNTVAVTFPCERRARAELDATPPAMASFLMCISSVSTDCSWNKCFYNCILEWCH